jgi:hypothetical protein
MSQETVVLGCSVATRRPPSLGIGATGSRRLAAQYPVRSRLSQSRARSSAGGSGRLSVTPPLSEMGEIQRREFYEALLDADAFEDLPGKWQAAILEAEQSRPKLRVLRWRHPGCYY